VSKYLRFVIDILHDYLLIEIQTRHLYALRLKLRRLCYYNDESQCQEKRL
jgi:hypothetical protein